MTTYGAYEAGLPCKNPSCKSHGKPHPNCRCYGGYAEGGVVDHFCSVDRPHGQDCQYYAGGGEVKAEDILAMGAPSDPADDIAGASASAGAHGLFKGIKDKEALDGHAKKGHSKLDKAIKALFAGEKLAHEPDEKAREKVEKYLEGGGLSQNIAGQVHGPLNDDPMLAAAAEPTALSMSHPVHNTMLQTVRGRVANYLDGMRPAKHGPKLAFDDHMDDPGRKRAYKAAIDLANDPSSVLAHVSKGTLSQDHVKHLTSMFPEMNDKMQRKLTEKIVEAQLNGKKPSYKVRQSLSLLMGVDLSSDMTPQMIQAAQAVFAPKQAPQQQPPTKPKKSTAPLTKSDKAYLTGDQARESRQQRDK